jgi:uncharacterized protein (TIGR02677 family)
MHLEPGELFHHISAEKSAVYRAILDAFAAAKREYRLQLRPDEILIETKWPNVTPPIEEIQAALNQLTAWGNLQSQPDTARVATLNDYYRLRFLYRLSKGGEAVESALEMFAQMIRRRAELQSVALEDIANRLQALRLIASTPTPDDAKVHETLRDLIRVFEDLVDNAQAFIAGIGRSVELTRGDATAVVDYKRRLIGYLDRFISELVSRSAAIAESITSLEGRIEPLLVQAAHRESRNAAPYEGYEQAEAMTKAWQVWRERWKGLKRWFVGAGHDQPQAALLRAKALSAIPQLLAAIAAVNERRGGRSDRSADFRVLAVWFAFCDSDSQANRMARAAFALNPARHFSILPDAADLPASTRWAEAPPVRINPRLREYGEAAPRGPLPGVRDRHEERELLARQVAEEHRQVETARSRFADRRPVRLSELGHLDAYAFRLFLNLLGEALTGQGNPDETVERYTADGLLCVRLEPLGPWTRARIETDLGVFSGRDHVLTVRSTEHVE